MHFTMLENSFRFSARCTSSARYLLADGDGATDDHQVVFTYVTFHGFRLLAIGIRLGHKP